MPAMTPADALAALRDGARYSRRDERPVKLKLDTGLSIEAPGPRVLAGTFVLPRLAERRDVFSSGKALLGRLKGSDESPVEIPADDLRAAVRTALAALPDRADAGRPYRDARLLVSEGGTATVDAYLADVVLAVRRLAPVWRPRTARPVVERGPAKTPAERMAASRVRWREAMVDSCRRYLLAQLAEGEHGKPPALVPGDVVLAADLYEEALEYLWGEEIVPGPRVFYGVADEILGARRRGTGGARVYTIPEPVQHEEKEPAMTTAPDLAEVVLDRVVEKIAAEVREEIRERLASGDRVGALKLQREHHGGNVVDLHARRSRAV